MDTESSTPTRCAHTLETLVANAKDKARQALEHIVKWAPNTREETIAKLAAIEALVTSYAGLDTLQLTNIRLNLRDRIQKGA